MGCFQTDCRYCSSPVVLDVAVNQVVRLDAVAIQVVQDVAILVEG